MSSEDLMCCNDEDAWKVPVLPCCNRSETRKAFRDFPELRSKVLGFGEAFDLEKQPGQLGLRRLPELSRLIRGYFDRDPCEAKARNKLLATELARTLLFDIIRKASELPSKVPSAFIANIPDLEMIGNIPGGELEAIRIAINIAHRLNPLTRQWFQPICSAELWKFPPVIRRQWQLLSYQIPDSFPSKMDEVVLKLKKAAWTPGGCSPLFFSKPLADINSLGYGYFAFERSKRFMQNATRQANVLQYKTMVEAIGARVPQEIFDMIIVEVFKIEKFRDHDADKYQSHPCRLFKAAATKSGSFHTWKLKQKVS